MFKEFGLLSGLGRRNSFVGLLAAWLVFGLLSCNSKNPTAPAKGFPSPEADAIGFHGPRDTDQFSAEVALAWFNLAYNLTRDGGLTPPVASRNFGYLGVALYEAVVPGMPEYRSLAGQLNGLTELPKAHGRAYYWPAVANAALARTIKGLFQSGSPATQAAIAALEQSFFNQFRSSLPKGILMRSARFGKAVGSAILNWSQTDGYTALHNCAYAPPVGTGLWQPTPPAFAPALEPCWGELRPFALSAGSICDPGAPPEYSEVPGSDFFQEADEVYQTVNNLTAEQTTIALFWADGGGTITPPGHSISILGQVIQSQNLSLAQAAEAYAKVGMAVADAFISCWWAKYQYNLLRPITYIRNVIDATWSSLFPTPPFPEYTSGHSVQSGAAAQVMTDLFGVMSIVDHTHDSRGFAPRSFDSFFECAEEAAISRLYGGIHFRAAIDKGIEQGICVGQQVSALQFKKLGL